MNEVRVRLPLAVALVALLAGCGPAIVPNPTPEAAAVAGGAPPASAEVAPAGTGTPLPSGPLASVVRVIDGDTIDVTLDGRAERVRYYGNDAPERGERCYAEATARNRELAGRRVYLEADARDRDPNGRLLRYVYAQDGTFVDAQLIREGLATAWTADGKHRDYLMRLEEEARRNGVGCLWR